MKITKMLKKSMIFVVVALVTITLVGCGGGKVKDTGYTYRTYTALSPSNWNELTYQDSNDTQIMSYIGDSFFQYNFKYDENGEILPGEFVMEFGAATALTDVSAEYVGEENNIQEGEKGRAYKITLREDLKWDDGTPINAHDFVYTMQEQLNPLFQNYRADSFYLGATVIKNAEAYAKQGQVTLVQNCTDADTPAFTYEMADLVKGADGVYALANGRPAYFALNTALLWCGGKTVTQYSGYMDAASFAALKELANEAGNVQITDESIALMTTLIDTDDWGHETAAYLPLYVVYEKEFEEVAWDEVGFFAADDYNIVMILAKPLALLKEDGTLSYQAAYNMASLPLVKKDLYEECKIAPATGSTLWTTNYNSSVETSASWGPYKLDFFQAGKEYVLVRNDNWYGYNDPRYEGQYQTDKIVCETIAEWKTAWLKFQKGEIDGIGIDVTIADEYKNSDRAYFTPDDFVASLQLQSDAEALKSREEAGFDKEILANVKFRNALSLAINREDFAAKTTTSSLKGFGLFNSMHYYDVENGGVYRNTDDAKKVLCEIYGVDYTKFATLDEAVDTITGYDLALARQLLTEAYEEELAAGRISATDKVKLTCGSGAINETVTRRFNYIMDAWKELAKTTPLEGRIEFDDIKDFADKWADDFRAGDYDVCMGGWSGAAWDPGYFLLAYLSPSYMYSTAWDTASVQMTFTMKGVAEDGGDITETMSLIEWYYCLNGVGKYDWSSNGLPQEKRLQLIAALEKEVLKVYYSVPLYNSFGASLLSYKVDYTTYEYNTFMGYGGIRYMTYNYNNSEWDEFVSKNNGQIDYK